MAATRGNLSSLSATIDEVLDEFEAKRKRATPAQVADEAVDRLDRQAENDAIFDGLRFRARLRMRARRGQPTGPPEPEAPRSRRRGKAVEEAAPIRGRRQTRRGGKGS